MCPSPTRRRRAMFRCGPSPWCPRHDLWAAGPWYSASSTPSLEALKRCRVATPSFPKGSMVSVSGSLRATCRVESKRLSHATGRPGATGSSSAGAVVGPRNSGYSRSTTVPSGQSAPQLNSRIGRHRAAGPYMACKGSGVQTPSAPPAQGGAAVADHAATDRALCRSGCG